MASATWVDGVTAMRILDVPSVKAVDRLVAEGLISVRKLPGIRQRYRRDDCEALARNSLVPARSAPTTEAASS
jgi:hypothetical protein